jgi:hypothetical protein
VTFQISTSNYGVYLKLFNVRQGTVLCIVIIKDFLNVIRNSILLPIKYLRILTICFGINNDVSIYYNFEVVVLFHCI